MALHKLSLHLSRQEIAQRVNRLARDISRDYTGRCPYLIGVLKGSFIFLADLVRELNIPLTLDFIQAPGYRFTTSTGQVGVADRPGTALRGRHVLLVEDIVGTGTTVAHLLSKLGEEEPATLKLCTLLDKPSQRLIPVTIDYGGFTVPDKFVVGYGLDVDQRYRYFPGIYVLEES